MLQIVSEALCVLTETEDTVLRVWNVSKFGMPEKKIHFLNNKKETTKAIPQFNFMKYI